MRIIGGMAGGIRLQAPEGRAVRPTEDRVKESMFSTIGDLQGKVVIDLFSGTGALGLEALSRGASSVYFLEKEKRHADFIKANLAAVQKSIGAKGGSARIVCADARHAPEMLPDVKPDVILADPPYAAGVEDYGASGLILDRRLASWAGKDCLLVLEHAENNSLPWEKQEHWRPIKTKAYGIRAVSFAIGGEEND